MSNGFMGKILWVDISDKKFKEERLSNEMYRQYIGGYGLATKLIYENMPINTSPLSEEAIFGFFPGLFTGTIAPLSGRYMIAGKSALTGTWGDANCGGYFGPEIKKCGFDAIIIKGKSDNPIYISIIDNDRQIINASDLWGLDTVQTEDWLVKKHGNVRVACIGPSGEKISLISGIVNDKGRIAARSGFGATMGYKNVKALVLRGNNKVKVANKETLTKIVKHYNKKIRTAQTGSTASYRDIGTCNANITCGIIGDAPVKNWGGNVNDDFPMNRLQNISGIEINKFKESEFGCYSCPVQCGAIMKIPQLGIEETHLPEYETCASFGHMLLNDDLMSLFQVNDLCNRAGIDTISTGCTIAFAIECYENGILTKDDTEGIELTWGNSEAIIELTKRIIKREGIGDILADGSKRASEKIGKGSKEYAMHSMGQELPMHDPKFFKSLGFTYAFDPTPGRHTATSLDILLAGVLMKNEYLEGFILPKKFKRAGDDRYDAFKMVTGLYQFTNSLGLCLFTYYLQTYPLMECIKSILGWDLTYNDIIETGQRIQTLRQAFTLREGAEIAHNKLPGRAVGEPPFQSGPHKGKSVDYKAEYKAYCEKMGWNPENGYPSEETLKNLNLEFVIKDLY